MGIYIGRGSLRSSYPSLQPIAQPNPYNFRVVKQVKHNGNLLAWINYPDATNFEGNKILVIKGLSTLDGVGALDPHFLETGTFTIVARFRPTEEGWKMGQQLLAVMG